MAKQTSPFTLCHQPLAWLVQLAIVGIVSGLAGCVALPAPDENADQSATKTILINTEVPAVPFDSDTLYSLLVAEMAAYEQRFDVTLDNYLAQTRQNRDPGLAERTYEIASFLNQRQAAVEAAQLWFDIDPDNPLALKAKAVEALWEGDIGKALPDLAVVREKTGSAPFQFVAVQAANLSEEQRDKLVVQYRKLLHRWPDDHALQVGLAMLFQQQDDLDSALALLERIEKKGEGDAITLRLKGQVLADMGRIPQALEVLRSALIRYPNDVRLRLFLGRFLVKNGDLTEAQREFEILVEQHPVNPDLLISVGLIAMENGLPGQAGLYFSRLAKLSGHADVAHFHMGRLAQQMGDLQEGIRYFLAVKPGVHLVPAYAAMTRMLADRSLLTRARNELKKARTLYPDYAPQFYLIEGEVLLEQRRYDSAVEILNQAVARYPKNIGLLYSRAMLAERLDDLPLSERYLRRILVLDPDNAITLNALGYTLANRTNRLAEAKKLIYRAYNLDSNDPSILDSLGWVEYRLGNYQQALVWLRKAYEQMKDAEVAAHLSEVLWALGHRDEAQAILNDAQERQPNAEILQLTLDRLLSTVKNP